MFFNGQGLAETFSRPSFPIKCILSSYLNLKITPGASQKSPVRSHETILPFSQGSCSSYDTTWEEAVRGCTIRGYDFFSINIMQ